MNSNVERAAVPETAHGVVEGGTVRDDAAGGDDAVVMGFDGAAGHAGMEADVVGSDDEPGAQFLTGSVGRVSDDGAALLRRRGFRISG